MNMLRNIAKYFGYVLMTAKEFEDARAITVGNPFEPRDYTIVKPPFRSDITLRIYKKADHIVNVPKRKK